MDDTTPSTVTAKTSRFAIWLPRWGWCLLPAVVLVIAYAGISVWLPYRQEQQVIQKIEGWGGSVKTATVAPIWLQRLVGKNELKQFKVFERVVDIWLVDAEVTDAGLAHVSGLMNVQQLHLASTAVTDAGLIHLSRLTDLKRLSLTGTTVTDAGLVHLSGFSHLEFLHLGGTAISDAGLAQLSGLKKLQRLQLNLTSVSDTGLAHLYEMKDLKVLVVYGTEATDFGIESLKSALPDCEITR